jgi:hypothetical protein
MALLYMDGFEEYDSNAANFWTEVTTTQPTNGVRFTYSLNNNYGQGSTTQTRTLQNGVTAKSLFISSNVLGLTIPTPGTLHFGFGIFSGGLLGYWLCGVANNVSHSYGANPSNGIRLIANANGTLSVVNNNTSSVLGTSTGVISNNAWYYIEMKYVFGSGTSGAVQVRVNDTDYINVTGVDTAGGAASVNNFYFQSYNVTYYDDFYICDNTGATNNTFLGPIGVYTMVPTGNSTPLGMTASAGSNYACVDEIPWNSTDYVTANASGQTDMYTLSGLPGTLSASSVPGVLVKARSMKPTVNSGQAQLVVSNSTFTSYSANKSITQASYISNCATFELQPNGSAWTQADIGTMVAGVKIV